MVRVDDSALPRTVIPSAALPSEPGLEGLEGFKDWGWWGRGRVSPVHGGNVRQDKGGLPFRALRGCLNRDWKD